MTDYSNNRRRIQLLTNLTTNAAGSAFDWIGGEGFFLGAGTFGSGTLKLEYSPNGGTTWYSLGSTYQITAVGGIFVKLPAGKIRASVTGGSAASISALLVAYGR